MSTQTKELIAIPDPATAMAETALKQLTVMFHRIAIQGLFVDYSKVPFLSPEFTKRRNWLAELGILFDLDVAKLKGSTAQDYSKTRAMILDDTDSFTKPTFGMGTLEMVAARNDEEKAAEIRKRGAEARSRLADGTLDPQKMLEISLRLTTNMMRLLACQLRDVESVDAYPVISPEFNSFEQDDPRITKHDVLRICIGALPVPVDYVPWEQIIEYRNDPDTQSNFLLIKDWMSAVARATFTPSQVEETLEYLSNRFRGGLQTHGINTTTTSLYAYVATTPEFVEMLAEVGPDWGTHALFSIDHCKLGLLDNESTSPGSIVAFLLPIDFGFSTEGIGNASA